MSAHEWCFVFVAGWFTGYACALLQVRQWRIAEAQPTPYRRAQQPAMRCKQCGDTYREPTTALGRWWRKHDAMPLPGQGHWRGSCGGDMPDICGPYERVSVER